MMVLLALALLFATGFAVTTRAGGCTGNTFLVGGAAGC